MPDQPPFPKPRTPAGARHPGLSAAPELLLQFLDYLVVECGLTRNTVVAYESDLRQFMEHCKRTHAQFPRGISRSNVRAYLEETSRAGHQVLTVRRRISSVRAFFRYLSLEGIVEHDPTEDLVMPKAWARLPQALSPADAQRLVRAPNATNSRTPERDRAILELLYGTGLRVSELCNLELDSLRLDDEFLKCRGKGRKERLVPLGGEAARTLQAYLDQRVATPEERTVFLSVRGRPLGRETVFRLLRKYATEAGLNPDISPHTLRHSYATHMLAGGAGLREVQELLGHADIRTTEIYTHVDRQELKKLHEKFHPRG